MDSFALKNIDDALSGMTESWLGLVQGPDSSGKSAVLDRLCLEAFKGDQEVWYFCLDQDGPERYQRLDVQLGRHLPEAFSVLVQDSLRDIEFFRWLDRAPDGSLVLVDSLAGIVASQGGPQGLLRQLASVQNQRSLRVLISASVRGGPVGAALLGGVNHADFVLESTLTRPPDEAGAGRVRVHLTKNRFGDTASGEFSFELRMPEPRPFNWQGPFPRWRPSSLAE